MYTLHTTCVYPYTLHAYTVYIGSARILTNMDLTVEEEHLLKRELLRLELNYESVGLDNMVNLDQLGAPFTLPTGQFATGEGYPLSAYILRNFVTTFPLLKHAKPQFWAETAQPFIQNLASKEISTSADRDQATKRRRVGKVVKRLLLLFFVAGLSTNRRKLKLDSAAASIAESSASASTKSTKSAKSTKSTASDIVLPPPVDAKYSSVFASVMGCREVTSIGIMRNKTHSEYILECFPHRGASPVYVARSWQDFVDLSKQLDANLPGKQLPALPMKTLKNTTLIMNDEKEIMLMREPQRVLLRQYIKKLCFVQRVAHSQIFQSFLFKDPIVLSPSECTDIENRLILDKKRLLIEQEFVQLTKDREAVLGTYILEIKKQILLEDALPKLFMEMKEHQRVEDMSPLLQKFVEWCLVQLAGVLFNLFIAKDSSPEFFSQIKRLHSLMPYTAMRGILKLSNPAIIFKKMTDLFMATPFGSKSLLQQMFIRLLNDDMKSQEVLIAELEKHINKELVRAVDQYVKSDHLSRTAVQKLASETKVDIIMEIISENCSKQARAKVSAWYKEWLEVVANTEATEEQHPQAEKYSQLKDLLKLKVRAHDKQVLQEFWSDPDTMKFIREVVNLTYDVLIDIFRYANISESLGDFQKFMNDLISYVTYVTKEVVINSEQIVTDLLNLLKKHQNTIFKFIHRVYSRDTGFFVDFVQWMSLFVEFVKLGKQGSNKLDLIKLVSESSADLGTVKTELNALQEWLDLRKRTAKDANAGVKSEDFPVSASFDISDIGLSQEDVDFDVAEIENENLDEFVIDPKSEFSNDPVLLERLERQKRKDLEARKAQLKPRPQMKETEKLLPAFTTMVYDLLGNAKLDPVKFS